MNFKKWKIISPFILFGLCSLLHFGYTIMPNPISAIFFPVNESIFEHMKIIYTSIMLSSIIEYFIYKYKNIRVNNFILSIPIVSIIGIVVYLIIYLTIDKFISHNLFISILLLYLVFIFCEYISYKILNYPKINNSNKIGLILIILSYFIFWYFTYYPEKNYIFLDTTTNSYSLKKLY